MQEQNVIASNVITSSLYSCLSLSMKENGIILHWELLILDTSSNEKVVCTVRRQKRDVNAVQLEIIIQRDVDLLPVPTPFTGKEHILPYFVHIKGKKCCSFLKVDEVYNVRQCKSRLLTLVRPKEDTKNRMKGNGHIYN